MFLHLAIFVSNSGAEKQAKGLLRWRAYWHTCGHYPQQEDEIKLPLPNVTERVLKKVHKCSLHVVSKAFSLGSFFCVYAHI